MNKKELVDSVAAAANVTKTEAAKVLDGMLAGIGKALKKGDSVTLVGFGTFSTTKRAARKGKNPQTGKEIAIPARKVARFKPGKALKDALV